MFSSRVLGIPTQALHTTPMPTSQLRTISSQNSLCICTKSLAHNSVLQHSHFRRGVYPTEVFREAPRGLLVIIALLKDAPIFLPVNFLPFLLQIRLLQGFLWTPATLPRVFHTRPSHLTVTLIRFQDADTICIVQISCPTSHHHKGLCRTPVTSKSPAHEQANEEIQRAANKRMAAKENTATLFPFPFVS